MKCIKYFKHFVTFDTIEHHLGKETLKAERINATGVPFTALENLISHDAACYAFLYLESLRRENIFC